MHLILKCLSLSQMNRHRSLTNAVSQVGKASLGILDTSFRRSVLSFIKLGQWSKKWHVVSIFNPQLQFGLNESRAPCLNLCSRRWLNPRLSFVRYLIPLVLKQLCVLLGEGLINFKIHFLKMLRLLEFRIDKSRLFHSIAAEGKNEFLKKLCLIWKRGKLIDDLVMWGVGLIGSNS